MSMVIIIMMMMMMMIMMMPMMTTMMTMTIIICFLHPKGPQTGLAPGGANKHFFCRNSVFEAPL